MRIALLHPSSPTAEGTGAVHSATIIGESLQSNGHDVVFYCPSSVDPEYDAVETVSLSVSERTLQNKYSAINKAITEVKSELAEYDILHSYLMRTIPAVGSVTSEYQSLSSVVSLNAYGAVCPKNDLLYKNKQHCQSNSAIRCSDCVLASKNQLPPKPDRGRTYQAGRVIHHTIKDLKNYPIIRRVREHADEIDAYQALSTHVKSVYEGFDFPPNRIVTVPNILDQRFDIPSESSSEPPYRLLYVGGLKKHKGVDRLPAVIDRLQQVSEEKYTLSIVGEGPLEPYLRSEINERRIAESVDLLGFVQYDELPKVYANHNLFIYPGRWNEPFGRVFLEALATGTPVVSTDVGSAAEIIGSGGIVVDGSIDEFVGAIRDISAEEFEQRASAAKTEAKRYEREKIVRRIEELYEDAIA